MTPSEILRKHEDANEMHFHEVDRKWIIEAMEEYAALRQPPVSGRSEQLPCEHRSYRSGHSPFVPCICNDCGEEL